jgi:glutamate-5-semialdehyde dehydrogenase
MSGWHAQARRLGEAAREASAVLATADGGVKDAVLRDAGERILRNAKLLMDANAHDLAAGREAGLSSAMLDRLTLSEARIETMVAGLGQVRALPDPVWSVVDGWTRPSGLRLRRVRVPLGVVLIIFESRPNVTVDAASLCLKSGNACILRGGREAIHTNRALGAVLAEAVEAAGLPGACVQVVETTDRALVPALLAQEETIDLAIPRGGKGLIRTVMEHARMPILKHLDGICHVYVDAAADLETARAIVLNAKVQRPGVCNAMETLLVHREAAKAFLPGCLAALREAGVELRGDDEVRPLAGDLPCGPVTEEDFRTEYLDLVLNVAIVPDLAAAIRHINTFGSHHTDAIVTGDLARADRFQREVDSASVMVNASTRFSDGFEYGLGAEIGISTDKFHARGPVGLEGLTTVKWIVEGTGQVRT